jgi:TolB-like protein/DNA-binding winged helix-turn-helix (wHTH) protein
MTAEIYQFEDFELDRGAYQLRRAGGVVRLERIPLDLLFLLVERRGQLVTRDEILDRIWGKEVFLDVDNSINTAVRKIRQALKDNPESPHFLRTVSGKGYRFEASLVESKPGVTVPTGVLPAGAPAVVPGEVPPQTERTNAATRRVRLWPFWLGLAAMLVVAVLVARTYLRSVIPRPNSGKVMLVVLPFENLSGDSKQDYFVDGMTEEMITQLGSLDPAHLGVIARTSAMQYKNAHKDAAQVGRELGVAYLLEGSVRREVGRVRVTAQLIQTSDQTHIWADSYDRDLGDILKLQSEVARAIAGKIQLTLSQQVEARLSSATHVNAEAHEAYLEGLQASYLRTQEGSQQAIAAFSRAVSIDANEPLAYAGLARVYALAPVFGARSSETMPRAREAALRALALNDSLAEAHTTLAFVRAHFEYDWPAAEREYRRALELNPSDAYAHFFYSNSYLSPFGRHDEAISEMKRAAELDPLSMPIQSFVGRTYLWARRYDEARAEFQKAGQLDANFAINHERLAHLYTYVEKYDDAIEEETRARMLAGEDPKSVLRKQNEMKTALRARGPRGYWETLLEFSKDKANPPEAYTGNYGVAILYARLGEKDKSMDALDKAYVERQLAMTEIGIEPALDSLRSETRFQELLRQVGLAK